MPGNFLISHLIAKVRIGGLAWLGSVVRYRILSIKPNITQSVLDVSQNRVGLEIGGPSKLFKKGNILPAYSRAKQIDNVNFSRVTAWESDLFDGGEFHFNPAKPPGRQFLREATLLDGIPDATYDFVLSSHCLEHLANPLAALREWARVTRDGGHLLLILPDPQGTFDHRRPITTIDHLRHDFTQHTGEDDLTHLPEIVDLHHLALDRHAGSPEQFRARCALNRENRCMHHHVFNLELMRKALHETGWNVLETEKVAPIHLIALAKKI